MVSQMDRNEKDEAVMNEEVSLEDSFKYYEAGMKLVKTCGGKIDKVEKQILVLNGNNTEDVR